MADDAPAKEVEEVSADPEGDTTDFDDEFAKQSAGDTEEDDGADKAPVEEPATEDEPVQAAAEQETVDIWAGATPEQTAAHEAAVADAHKWQSDQGRQIADRTKIAALEKTIADGAATAATDEIENTGSIFDSEDWKTVSEELPEVAGPLQRLFNASEAKSAKLEKELSSFSEERRTSHYNDQYDIALNAHPDLVAVTGDPAFVTWAGTQPAFVQEMLGRNAEKVIDGHEAAHVVSLYKANEGYVAPATANPEPADEAKSEPATGSKSAGETKQDRANARRLETNVSAPAKGPGAASGPADDFDSAFDHYASKKVA